jgi:hypothetical protein
MGEKKHDKGQNLLGTQCMNPDFLTARIQVTLNFMI